MVVVFNQSDISMKRFGPSSRLWRIVKKAGADSAREKKIRNLLEQDKFVCGYVPYIPEKTDIILYNFFGINYGCRSGLTLLVSLVDKNFTLYARTFLIEL